MTISAVTALSRVAFYCALALTVVLVSGCGMLTEVFKDLRDTASAKPAFTDSQGEAPFDLAKDCMPSSQDGQGRCVLPADTNVTGGSTYHRISTLQLVAPQVLWRNRFQDYLVWRSEKQCQIYKSSIIATQNGVNFALNTLTTGTAGVAAIVIAPAANILGGIAAISNGVRGHFNEDFFQRFVAPAIVAQIDKLRADQLTKIMMKRGVTIDSRPTFSTDVTPKDGLPTRAVPETLPAKFVLPQDYTLEESIGDAERYHQLCSSTVALAALLKDDTKFADSSTGLKARLAELTTLLTNNLAQIEALRDKNKPNENDKAQPATLPYTDAIKQLSDANTDLAKQITILQRQMLTAPTTRP